MSWKWAIGTLAVSAMTMLRGGVPEFATNALLAHFAFEKDNLNLVEPSVPVRVMGQVGRVIRADGTGGAFDGNTSLSQTLGGSVPAAFSGSFTVSTWIRTRKAPAVNSWWSIVNQGLTNNPAGLSGFALFLQPGNNAGWEGKVTFEVSNASSQWPVVLSAKRLDDGLWHHLVGVYDAPGRSVLLYVDGVIQGTATAGFSAITNRSPLSIGGSGVECANCRFQGDIDEVRVHNRAMSGAEARNLHAYDRFPMGPRVALGTAQVVNGFLVGIRVVDSGFGYTNPPSVAVTGGSGGGAVARARIGEGRVTGVEIQDAGAGYLSPPGILFSSPPFPPRRASAIADVAGGGVADINVTDGGMGYPSPPTVYLVGGGGTGATAVASLIGGSVTSIALTNPGTGYTSPPVVKIGSPPFTPSLGIEVRSVQLNLNVVLGVRYQVQTSENLVEWVSIGTPFVAMDELVSQVFDVGTVGRYFRILQVP